MRQKTRLQLKPKTQEDAGNGAKEVLEKAKTTLGFIPNLYANLANSPSSLSTYFYGYSQFREKSGFTPAEQEVVLLTISRENGCRYCVAAHSMVADKMSGTPPQAVAAIRGGGVIEDAKLSALSRFARQMVLSRGLPLEYEVKEFLQSGYKEEHILEIVLAIAIKTISNYTSHLFDIPIDPAFASYAWEECR